MNKFSLGDRTSLYKDIKINDLDAYNNIDWTIPLIQSLRSGITVEDISKIGTTTLIGTYIQGSWIYIPSVFLNDKKDCGHPYTSIFK